MNHRSPVLNSKKNCGSLLDLLCEADQISRLEDKMVGIVERHLEVQGNSANEKYHGV